jgi:hypothetical protein
MTNGPIAPTDMLMPHTWENVFLVLVLIPAVGVFGWAVRNWRRTGDVLPFGVFAGGFACALLEPLVDVLGACWYPRGQQFQVFELMGRPIPLFAVVGYAMMFGGFTVVVMEVLKRRGARSLWYVWWSGIAFTAMFEFFAINTGSYTYYGQAPLRLFGWPTWWGPVNSLVAVAAAVLLLALRPLLRGWHVLLAVPLLTMVDGGVNGAAAWPVYTVYWSDVPPIVSHLAGLVTWALAALGVWLTALLADRLPLGPAAASASSAAHQGLQQNSVRSA